MAWSATSSFSSSIGSEGLAHGSKGGEVAKMKFSILTLSVMSLSSAFASSPEKPATESAVIGGGCFWCVEAVFENEPGVFSVTSGYAGGETPDPTYEQVCTGRTGHAEVVRIDFDPAITNYRKIIDLFWKAHDPTTLNRQGADVGTQYRSIILYDSEAQRATAEESQAAAQADFKAPIVTEIVPLKTFYPAEKYHQDFYANNPAHPYNQAVIRPKLEKLDKVKH